MFDFAEEYNISAALYEESIDLYEDIVQQVVEVNEIAETIVNKVGHMISCERSHDPMVLHCVH